jgi:hypothetical protein
MQNQLGLKLLATKATVGVMVVDHVETPTGNELPDAVRRFSRRRVAARFETHRAELIAAGPLHC